MTFDPGEELSAEEVADEVTTAIEQNSVTLFMKGTEHMPQCGYSRSALALLQRYVDDVTVVNVLAGPTDVYRETLEEESGWTTIPQVFVDGEFIGGADILEQLEKQGELAEKLGEESMTGPF